jgi:hypothetical protein
VAAIQWRIAALRSQLSVPDPSRRPDGRKLALFFLCHWQARFVITPFPHSTCPFPSLWENWLCFARLSPTATAPAAPAASASVGRSEVNWLCLTRCVPPVAPAASDFPGQCVANWVRLARMYCSTAAPGCVLWVPQVHSAFAFLRFFRLWSLLHDPLFCCPAIIYTRGSPGRQKACLCLLPELGGQVGAHRA